MNRLMKTFALGLLPVALWCGCGNKPEIDPARKSAAPAGGKVQELSMRRNGFNSPHTQWLWLKAAAAAPLLRSQANGPS
jgi:hypothetical protein